MDWPKGPTDSSPRQLAAWGIGRMNDCGLKLEVVETVSGAHTGHLCIAVIFLGQRYLDIAALG